jgi:hypothetical protein
LHFIWKLTCALRRRVEAFEVLSRDQRRRLEAMGIPRERMAVVRDPSPVQFTGNEHPLPIPAELKDRIVLLYSGNWGNAHDVNPFVEGYLRHHREGSGLVGLWINAVGSGADQIEERLCAQGLPVARTRPLPLAIWGGF